MMETLYFGKTYDEVFDNSWRKFTSNKEDHTFRHYNNSLGMMIYSKEHLKIEMKKRRMFPMEVCEGLAEEWDKKKEKYDRGRFDPSEKAMRIINGIKMLADKDGNIKLGGRAIEALREIGAINETPGYMGRSGGWD